MLKKIAAALVFMFLAVNAAAQNSQISVQLIEYDADTHQSKIQIQNTAGFELNEIDLYINNIRTGRAANKLADGKAVLYYQTITPGTYDLVIKTKEGVELAKQVRFGEAQATQQDGAAAPKTASQLAEDPKYQELLNERAIEQKVREQRQEAKLEQQNQESRGIETSIEEKGESPEKASKSPKYFPMAATAIILIAFIFILIYFFNRKKRK